MVLYARTKTVSFIHILQAYQNEKKEKVMALNDFGGRKLPKPVILYPKKNSLCSKIATLWLVPLLLYIRKTANAPTFKGFRKGSITKLLSVLLSLLLSLTTAPTSKQAATFDKTPQQF